jgi:iron complex outermembrane receptor protein
MRNFKLNLILGIAFVLPLGLATPALAQDDAVEGQAPDAAAAQRAEEEENEVVVTADRTGLRALQDTPMAVSVVGGSLIESQGLHTLKDLTVYVPNLAVSRNVGGSIVSIRGIGSNGGSDPSVATQVDGVYIGNSTSFTDFYDVERVEVLRGPQGTLYGRNTTGGTINFISRRPSSQFGGRVQFSYGNYDSIEASGYLTGPLGENVAASLALTYRGRDGFFENIVPGERDVDSAGNGGARLQVRWDVSPDIDATTRIDYFEADQSIESYDHLLAPVAFAAPLANSLVGSYRAVAINGDQSIDLQTGGISEEINWRVGDRVTLTSLTSWRRFKSTAFNDNDATEVAALQFRSQADTRQFTQEFNLRYVSDRFTAVTGLYYFHSDDQPVSHVEQPPSVATPANRAVIRDASPTLETSSLAAFAQLSYEIVPNLSLIVGARYTTEKTSFDQNFQTTSLNPATPGAIAPGFPILFSVDRRDDAFTPKFGLDFHITEDIMLYASATRGFKSGGFNGQATNPATAGYAPELIWSYETGLKTEWLDRRLRVNLTGFYYDYTDLQVRQLLGPGNSVIANAASATVKGIELEINARPTPDLQIGLIGSYLNARYDSFPTVALAGGFAPYIPNQNCVGGVCTIDASGNYLSDAPKWSGLISVDYTPRIGAHQLRFHVDYSHRSRRFFDPSNVAIASQDDYGLLNANINFGPPGEGWQVGLWGRNLTNAHYYQTVSGNGLAPGAIVGDPLTYGVRLGFSW